MGTLSVMLSVVFSNPFFSWIFTCILLHQQLFCFSLNYFFIQFSEKPELEKPAAISSPTAKLLLQPNSPHLDWLPQSQRHPLQHKL